MKVNSKKVENLNKQKKVLPIIQSIQPDETQFKQDGKLSNHKLPINNYKGPRYSENLKNVNLAYGGSTNKKQSHKINPQKDIQTKNNSKPPRKNISVDINDFPSENQQKYSTIKSLKSIQLQKLNGQMIGSNTTSVNDQINIQQRFLRLQTQEIRVQNKRTASSPPNKIQQKSFIQDRQKRKNNTVVQQKNLNKDKLKDLYDKIRNPEIKPSRFVEQTAAQTVSQLKLQQKQSAITKSPQKRKIEKEQYLEAITGRSSKHIESQRKITQKANLTPQQVLSGKVSIIWIFAVKFINPQIKERIIKMYNPLLDDDRAVPFVQNPKKIRQFLQIPHCYFKIVTDIASAEVAIGFRIYNTVIEFHIYNERENIETALQIKSITRKVKGIFTDWDKLMSRAQDQIQEQISIYRCNNGLQKRQRQRKFPNFLKLTDTDKTQATLYRINLYGAIKMLHKQKKQTFQDFMRLVLSKYQKNQDEQQNIQDYIKIDHHKQILTLSQAKLIIQFYVRQSFYYQVLNSMLRTMKTSQQFKPCILPFNQTYQSIRLYYQNYLKQSSYIINQMTLYRGCRLSKKDYKNLNKPGVFIQMLGFMSTSKSLQRAKDFVDRDGFIFVIHVKQRKVDIERFKNFDHGFVDINRYGLASIEFSRQQEVLFNALNVYQVQNIQQIDGYTFIHLNYGVIFDLLEKPKQELKSDQYDTLVNYYYCTKILGKIQDQGDVFLFANQLDEAKKYYDKKIKQGDNLAHNYFKLANVQKQCGQIDQAQQNANKALKMFTDHIDKDDRQNCLKVFSIHSKNAQISLQKEDYLTADSSIDRALQMLSEQQIFEKGVKLRQRGEIKFKKGQIKNAQKDFQQSESIFQNIRKQGGIRKVTAYKNYYLSHLSLLCSNYTRDDLKKQLNTQLNKVKQMEQKISEVNEDIQDELVKINKSLKDVSLYVQDRDKYQIYVKKAQSYLFSLQARKANDPQLKAKLLSMQAMIADYQQLAQSQKLMNQAIRLIESKNPFDMKVADYSKILAKMQKNELQKYKNPGKRPLNQKPDAPIPYDDKQRRQIYERCKNNFNKTIKVLMYHAKDKSSPEILQIKNQLGQLAFGQNDYEECQKIIKQVKQGKTQIVHSQMAKTLITMAKISYARGQLKNALQTLEQAFIVLQKAMVLKHKKQNQKQKLQKYQQLFQNSDTYLLIKFVRLNIYHKQKNHDLALKSVEEIGNVIIKKVGMNDSHPMLADLLEMRGCLQVFKGNIYGFDQYFQKAIQLRQKQFGRYHPVNGKTFCTYAKFLIMVKDKKRAAKMLEEAVQIFSAFDQNNPNYWTMFYSHGYFNQDNQQYIKSQNFYNRSLQWVQKYFNKSHITIKQVMLSYANSLNKSKKLLQSKTLYEQLQQQLDEGIRQSKVRSELNSQQDDEKVSLKKLMYTQLSQLESQELKDNQSYMAITNTQLIDHSLYKSKLSMLKNEYHISNRRWAEANNTQTFKKQFFQTTTFK